jgi:DNA polymerase III psi subunit
MTGHPIDPAFLQELFKQDTLYLIPEEQTIEVAPEVVVPVAEVPVPKMPTIPVTPKVETPAPVMAVAPEENAEAQEMAWYGEATKGTYLLFAVGQDEFSLMPQHQFLSKVLAAVGLETNQVKFGNFLTGNIQNIKELARQQQAKQILLFGETLPVENLLKLEAYKMYKADETRFVRVDSLAQIENNTELKKKLWDVLQKIFLQ